MGGALEHPPLTVSELPALLKAADVGQLGSFGTLARRGAVEAVVVPFQRKIGEMTVGEADVIVGQIRAKGADPVIVGDGSAVDVDNRGDVVTRGEAEGFFEEADMRSSVVGRSSCEPCFQALIYFKIQWQQVRIQNRQPFILPNSNLGFAAEYFINIVHPISSLLLDKISIPHFVTFVNRQPPQQ